MIASWIWVLLVKPEDGSSGAKIVWFDGMPCLFGQHLRALTIKNKLNKLNGRGWCRIQKMPVRV